MREQLLGLTTPLVAAVFSAVFLALWWRGKMGRHVLAFGVSYALATIAFLITHMMPTGSIFVFHLTNLFYALASALMVWGVCHRVKRPGFLGTQAVIYGIAATALTIAVLTSNEAGPRLLISNTAYGTMFLVGLVSLLGARRSNVMDTLVVVVVALNAADFMVRPTLQLLAEGAIPVGEYRQSVYYSVINFILSVKALSLALVLVGACAWDLVTAMRERSDRDPLTGLRNRRAFEEAVEQRLADAARDGLPLSIVVADIDHFKQVNDIWGHQAGDNAIANFGHLIAGMVRENDVCGRIGGEEFCIVVCDCSEESAAGLAERIRASFVQLQHEGLGEDIRLSASFGVAQWSAGEGYRRLFSRADTSLYRAKDNGRNRVECSGPLDAGAGRRIADRAEGHAKLVAA